MPQNCPCPKQDPLAQTVYPPQGGKVYQANFFSEKNFLCSTTTRKICGVHWWNPFLNPLTINGDICNFVLAVSGLSNRSQRSVYNYARRPILRTGLRPVQLLLLHLCNKCNKLTGVINYYTSKLSSSDCTVNNRQQTSAADSVRLPLRSRIVTSRSSLRFARFPSPVHSTFWSASLRFSIAPLTWSLLFDSTDLSRWKVDENFVLRSFRRVQSYNTIYSIR